MLTAFDADPTDLGYTPQQIERCLEAIDDAGVDQENEGAEHLYHLLKIRGMITGASHVCAARPEVEQLRFDPAASPPDLVPEDLRDRLLAILLQYADGMAARGPDGWGDADLPDAPSDAPTPPARAGAAE
jgi:hypothetical protein